MSDDIGKKEQIQILLAEYGTLRAELIQRTWWQMQMITVSGTITMLIFGFIIAGHIVAGAALLVIGAISLTFALTAIDRDSRILVGHVINLERRINDLGGGEFLTWETQHGLLAVSLGRRLVQALKGT
jgi:hypothetical protein